MRNPLLLASAAMVIAGTIAAAPSRAAGDAASTVAELAPAPPGPRGERMPPPPPPGPGVVVDRRADGTLHVDVRCPPRDAIKDCAVIAGDLLTKLNATVQAK